MATIREDIVSISFEVEADPFAVINKAMKGFTTTTEGAVKSAESTFKGMGEAAAGAVGGVGAAAQQMAESLGEANGQMGMFDATGMQAAGGALTDVVAAIRDLTDVAKAGFEGLGVAADAFASAADGVTLTAQEINNAFAGIDPGIALMDAAPTLGDIKQQMNEVTNACRDCAVAFDYAGGAIGDFAREAAAEMDGPAQGFDEATNSARTFTQMVREMASGLKEAVQTKVGEIGDGIRSSATAARDFASRMREIPLEKISSGADALVGKLSGLKNIKLKDVAHGLDTGLGKAVTKGGELLGKLRDVAGEKLSGLISGIQKSDDGLDDMRRGAKEAESALGDMGSKGASSASGLSSAFAKAMIGVELLKKGVSMVANTIKDAFGAATSRIDTTEQFGRVLNAMPTVKDAAIEAGMSVESMVGQISDSTTAIVTDTAYGLGTAMQGVQGLISRGIDPGAATESVQAMADAVAFYADGSDESFGRVNDAMSKMITSGKVSMQELNMLMDAGIPALDIFADKTGMSMEEVRDSISNGEISAEDFMVTLTDAIETGTNQFPALAGAAQDAGASWQGTFDNIRAATARGVAAVLGSMDELLGSSGLPNARQMMLDLGRSFGDVIAVFAGTKDAGEVFPQLLANAQTAASGMQVIGQGIANSLFGMMDDLPMIGETVSTLLGGLLQAVLAAMPAILLAGMQILLGLVEGFTAQLPALLPAALQAIMVLAEGLMQNLPLILTAGIDLVLQLILGIVQMLPQLVMMALNLIVTVQQALMDNLPMILAMGLQIVVALVQGIVQSLPMIITAAVQMIVNFIQFIGANLPMIIQTGVQILVALIEGLVTAIPMLIGMIPELFSSVIDAIMSVNWLDVGVKIISAIWDGIKSIGSKIWEGIKDLFTGGSGDIEMPEVTADTTSAAAAGTQTATAYESSFNTSMSTMEFTIPEIDVSGMTVGTDAAVASFDTLGGSMAGAESSMAALGAATATSSADMAAMGTSAVNMGADISTLDTTMATATTGMGTSLDGLATATTTTQTTMATEMNTIKTNTTTMADSIKTTLDTLATTLYTSGVNAMQGFNRGLESMRAAVLETARSIASAAANALNAELDINSPSRVTMLTGQGIDEGLILGMHNLLPDVTGAAREVALASAPGGSAGVLSAYTPESDPAVHNGGNRTVVYRNAPQFNLTIGGGTGTGDRELERKVKAWVAESFEKVIADNERGLPDERQA